MARLALLERSTDVRLFAARLVRKYRKTHPEIASELEKYLRVRPERGFSPLRDSTATAPAGTAETTSSPQDSDSRLSLLRTEDRSGAVTEPILAPALREMIDQLLKERSSAERLASRGLVPAGSAIFVGPPGVGKTLTARWIASQLGLPLLVLDLAAVMSSYLGRSGTNLRSAFDHARRVPCVLLLDEIDAIAKRRSDESDVGELKRLVTVIMQEVDEWPSTGLLLAATNHRELIDPALWRRFDLILEFPLPGPEEIQSAIERFAGRDGHEFGPLMPVLTSVLAGISLSDVERAIHRIRRGLALGRQLPADLVEDLMRETARPADRRSRIELAIRLSELGAISQHRVSELTGVSRDTLRKYQRDGGPEKPRDER
ncbi:MAG: ATPase [Gemmatimonas sp.]|nr:ATPase [Gemmatimonas sp.]